MLNSFLPPSSDLRQFLPKRLQMEPPAQLMRQHWVSMLARILYGEANKSTDDFLRDIASRHNWFNYQIADFKSEQGRPIFTAFLSDPKSKPTNSTKLRVWLQAATHGNEPAADQGAMALLGKMDANTTWTASLLEKMDIFVMPRYNPDGVHYFQRYAVMGQYLSSQ